ncbi:MAG: SDR family NAD(P)-dependent oxidoreductase [Candidatus Nanohaloarchaea archaeon]
MRVFVTGAANGIGKATVERLVKRNHKVIAYDIDGEALEELPEEVETYQGDVRDRDRLEEVVKQEIFGVLVNCAGFQEQGSVEEMPVEKFEKHMETNFYGTLNAVKAALPMIRERDGKIINVSSIAGKSTVPFLGAYSSSKHAVEALSDTLRMELRDDRVNVVLIEPGPIKTGFNERAEDALEKYLPDSRYAEKYRKRMEAKNSGAEPEKAAGVIAGAVEAHRPKARYTVTAQAFFISKLKPLIPEKIYDFLASRY